MCTNVHILAVTAVAIDDVVVSDALSPRMPPMASGFAASVGGTATAEELLAAGDIGPCELVQGQLVLMSPAGFEHGVVTQRIAALLHAAR